MAGCAVHLRGIANVNHRLCDITIRVFNEQVFEAYKYFASYSAFNTKCANLHCAYSLIDEFQRS